MGNWNLRAMERAAHRAIVLGPLAGLYLIGGGLVASLGSAFGSQSTVNIGAALMFIGVSLVAAMLGIFLSALRSKPAK